MLEAKFATIQRQGRKQSWHRHVSGMKAASLIQYQTQKMQESLVKIFDYDHILMLTAEYVSCLASGVVVS